VVAEPYLDSIHIEAEPDVVFDYFTRPEAIVQWMGDRALLDPRPGGRFVLFIGDKRVDGRYLEVDRPRRLVIAWGRHGCDVLPPGSSTLEVRLTPEDGGTRVHIVHSGLPESEREKHALGWKHYLGRMRAVVGGRELRGSDSSWVRLHRDEHVAL
jgi:uncharacterized protein YndB with AHSA1/START domain